MIRGTTPTHYFKHTKSELLNSKVYVTYKQGSIKIEKTNPDLEINENEIISKLTQAETLKFRVSTPVSVQIRYVTKNGYANASEIMKINVSDVLKDEVI